MIYYQTILSDINPFNYYLVAGLIMVVFIIILLFTYSSIRKSNKANQTNNKEEKKDAPKAKEKEKPTRIIFKGNLEEVNRFFYKRGWTDGLPVLPPTAASTIANKVVGTFT